MAQIIFSDFFTHNTTWLGKYLKLKNDILNLSMTINDDKYIDTFGFEELTNGTNDFVPVQTTPAPNEELNHWLFPP